MEVLEIGCGSGYFTKEIAKTGARLMAIDISPELIEIAINNMENIENVSFSIQNAYDMSFEHGYFDAIVGSSVLHHLEITHALHECFRVLKPGGTICFTEPNMLNPQIMFQKNIPFLKQRMGDSPDETAFFTWSLKNILKSSGFMDIGIHCFDFLHPRIPECLLSPLLAFSLFCEKIPLVSHIAGSLYITARKSA
jgi:ubiquinone/menaquinone biosynthesis C-methylase UbiE